MRSDFCIFILTHGRPQKVYTWDTLKSCGNEYPVFLIVDDEDKTKEEYEKMYPGRVIVFSKLDEASRLDTPDLCEKCLLLDCEKTRVQIFSGT